MPKITTNENILKARFNELKNKTKNFSCIESEVIKNNPKLLIIFRFIFGINQKEFGILLNKTYATISQYERGLIKKIPKIEAERIVQILKTKIPKNINFENIITNFQKFYDLSCGGQTQGILSAELKEMTEQEKKVEMMLKSINFQFETHKTFKTKIGMLNFDFWIPHKKTVIECTKSATKDKAESLSYRSYILKKEYKVKSIAIIDKRVSNGFIRRLSEFDHVHCDENLSDLKLVL